MNVVHFGATWAPSSQQLNESLAELKNELKDDFNPAYIDAEEVTDVSSEVKIEAVPTTVFYKEGKEIHRLSGYNPAELKNAIIAQSFNKSGPAAGSAVVPPPKKVYTYF